VTPGFLSDVLGVLCIVPATRPLGRRMLTGFLTRKLLAGNSVHTRSGAQQSYRAGGPNRRSGGPSGGGPDVVPGEVVD
jgi:UPF0716 protein FxsA